MTTPRTTHPCPSCGQGVSLTARYCGICGAPLAAQRDPATALRAELSGIAARLRATALLPPRMVQALDGLGSAAAHQSPRVVIVGELGRGCRALANRLAGRPVLKAGPSLRGAAAFLAADPDHTPTGSILATAALEVAPPLASGAEAIAEGVIPAMMRADVVVFALSAAQLLSGTERRLLTGISSLTAAPIALAVGRMEVADTDEDLDDIIRRTERFRDALAPSPAVFLLPADTDDAPRLQTWLQDQLTRVATDTERGWERRTAHLLGASLAILEGSVDPARTLPALDVLQSELRRAHDAARASARTHLEEGLSTIRDALAERLDDMTPEERIHSGASELAIAIEVLVRESVDAWSHQLADGLSEAELPAASIGAAAERPETIGAITGDSPKLTARLPDQSYGLMAAAVGLSVGVLMLPAGGSGTLAIGLGLTAGSVAVARVLSGQRAEELRQLHTAALDSWLREVGVRSQDWLVEHLDHAHERISQRLIELHDHAQTHQSHASPAALRHDLGSLLSRLDPS